MICPIVERLGQQLGAIDKGFVETPRRAAWAGNPDLGLSNREDKCREEGFGYRFLYRRKCVSRVRQDSLQVLAL